MNIRAVNLKSQIEKLILSYSFIPKTGELNQHFLIDNQVFLKLLGSLELGPKDTVLEIGAGFGILTRELARLAKSVVAVEIDERFAKELVRIRKDYRNVVLIFDNFLSVKPFKVKKIVGCLPFLISEPFIFKIADFEFGRGVFILGERFTRLMAAKPSDLDFGLVGLLTSSFFKVLLVEEISAEAFFPKPKVNAGLIVVEPTDENELSFEQTVLREVCKQRDKKIKNSLVEAFIYADEKYGKTLSKRQSLEKVKNLGLAERILDSKLTQLRNEEIRDLVLKVYR